MIEFGLKPAPPHKYVYGGEAIYPSEEEAARERHGQAMHGKTGMWSEETHRWEHKRNDTAVDMLSGPYVDRVQDPSSFIEDLTMVIHNHGEGEY